MSQFPNFLIAGAPRAGTTSLYHYLDQHPQIYMSAIKEPHFFSAEIREERFDPKLRHQIAQDRLALREFLDGTMRDKRFGGIVACWEDYLRLFKNATSQPAIGEASVCYLWSPTAAARIAERISDAKIIVMLRDPADRAFSQYLKGIGDGVISWSFREHIERNLRHRSGLFCIDYPFLEFGFYAEQLTRFLERFGANVWVGFYEDFRDRTVEVVQNICRFLGITPEFTPDLTHRYWEAQVPRLGVVSRLKRSGLWQIAAKVTPKSLRPLIRRSLIRKPGSIRMDPADRRYLIDFYREDILKLEKLLSHNFEAWLR